MRRYRLAMMWAPFLLAATLLAQPPAGEQAAPPAAGRGGRGGQGSPPGRNPVGLQLNILVGDAKAGEKYFDKACARCHSAVGDLKAIAAKYPEPRSLQNAWVAGAAAANPFGGGRGGGGSGN